MNMIYDNAKFLFMQGQINWVSDSIKVCLLDGSVAGYLGGLTAKENDTHYSDVSDFVLAGTENVIHIANRTANNYGAKIGVASGNDVTFISMAAGQTIGYICIFKDSTGNIENIAPTTPTESPLIMLFDSGYGIGGGTNGGNITIKWNTEFGIFQL